VQHLRQYGIRPINRRQTAEKPRKNHGKTAEKARENRGKTAEKTQKNAEKRTPDRSGVLFGCPPR
jgi:hypothetical protein